MKILILGRGYVSKNNTHSGIFEFDQAKSLVQIGHEVYMIALDIRSIRHLRRYGIFEAEKEGVKILYISYPCGIIPLKVREIISKRFLLKGYYELVEKYGIPDIIHSHFIEYSYYTIKTLRKMKRPIVVTEHSSTINQDDLDKESCIMGRQVYKSADTVISVSGILAKRIEKNFGVKSVIIPNALDTKVFKFAERNSTDSEFTFITVANLISSKKIDFLVTVFNKIAKKYKSTKLIIIGDGKEKFRIKNLIKKCGIQKQVIMTGNINRGEIKKYLDNSNCFVLPSQSETFGVSYIEAMATGLPVIATKCGGPEDFVDESNGILIEVDNEVELFVAMERMICNLYFFDSIKISQRTINRFSEKSIALQLEMEYEKAQSKY